MKILDTLMAIAGIIGLIMWVGINFFSWELPVWLLQIYVWILGGLVAVAFTLTVIKRYRSRNAAKNVSG